MNTVYSIVAYYLHGNVNSSNHKHQWWHQCNTYLSNGQMSTWIIQILQM